MFVKNRDSGALEKHGSFEGRGVMIGREFINRLSND